MFVVAYNFYLQKCFLLWFVLIGKKLFSCFSFLTMKYFVTLKLVNKIHRKMKLKFQLRIQKLHSMQSKSKAEAVMRRKYTDTKNRQIEEAVKYCIENNVRGYKALKTALFLLVKDRKTIHLGESLQI